MWDQERPWAPRGAPEDRKASRSTQRAGIGGLPLLPLVRRGKELHCGGGAHRQGGLELLEGNPMIEATKEADDDDAVDATPLCGRRKGRGPGHVWLWRLTSPGRGDTTCSRSLESIGAFWAAATGRLDGVIGAPPSGFSTSVEATRFFLRWEGPRMSRCCTSLYR